MTTKLLVELAKFLIDVALERAFPVAPVRRSLFSKLDAKLPVQLVRHSAPGATAVIEDVIEQVQGRPATPIEQALVRLAYDPVRGALDPWVKLGS